MEFSQIAILLVVAGGAGIVAKLFKQPLIIGYLFAGVILGATGFVHDKEAFEGLGQIGVALLLYLVGLEMNISEIPSIGKVALMTGLGQILFTSGVGYLLALALGFSPLVAIYIAIALTFSSTIIIIKLLSEKNELGALHGKISLGFLLVQDLVAILILMVLAGISEGHTTYIDYLFVFLKASLLLGFLYILSKYYLHKLLTKFVDSSGELIFIVSIAWALGLAAFVDGPMGLSLEIGGFLAGLSLSNMPEHLQIASRARPLRDFFLTIFFLVLGTNLVVGNVVSLIFPATILSLFVLIGNPIIVLAIMGFLGYRRKTSLSSSLTVAQISEFSLIMMSAGVGIGHVTENEVALVVMIGVITMTASTYMILHNDFIYKKLDKFLTIFERKHPFREKEYHSEEPIQSHVVLVGADRTGQNVLKLLKRKYDFIVVDYNPFVVENLLGEGIPAIFGDITDDDVQIAANLRKAKLIIMTTGDMTDNQMLIESLKGVRNKPKLILKARTTKEALELYRLGADYVIVPQVLAGEHIRHIVKNYGFSKKLLTLGKGHKKRLALSLT